ncbi:hypothetical protein V6N13_102687 [Hibiscus sabdariffa]
MNFQDIFKFALVCFDSLAWPLFALGYPLHASIQAILTNSDTDTKKLVTYWIIFSLLSLFEHAFMVILQWLPFWPYMKLLIVSWTMIPRFDGAFYVYKHIVHPCLYMDFPTIISWFKKLQEFYFNNFLAEGADEHVEAKRQPEALEKPNSNKIRAAEPDSVQTVNETVQKEWTCAMCQVKVPCEKTLKSHLHGRKHRATSKRLTEAKKQPFIGKVGSVSAVKEPWEGCSSSHVQARQKTDVAMNWARYFSACRTLNAVDISWQRPPQGWCCLNTNGAVAPATVAQLVDDKEAGNSPLSLVRAIFMFRQRCSMTKIRWIRREGNMVADGMAKLADSQHFQTTIYGVAPKEDLVKFALICFDSLAWPLFALGYPLRASIQAIETNSNTDTKKLVTYWIIFSLISLFEHAFMGILQWLPFWPYMKLMVVGWTMIPGFDGAFYVYNHFVHPCVSVDLPTIIVWLKQLQVFFLDNFLADAADEYVKVHRSPEALEKLVANRPKGTEPASILPADIKPVRVTEKREVALANPVKFHCHYSLEFHDESLFQDDLEIPAIEPDAVQTVNDMVMLPEIKGETGFDHTEIPSDKQVQKEWTCAMCQVKVTSEKTLNIHFQGRKHMNACEMLTKAKNQTCKGEVGSDSAVKEPSKDGSSSNASACYKAVNPKTETSKYLPIEESKKSVLATNVAGNQVKPSENVQGQQRVGKEHDETKIPQFRCTICNVSCTRLEDFNCHLWGRKHLAQIRKLSEGQVPPASPVAPKNSDIPNHNASACYKAVNPKTETTKRYMPIEESKKPELATNVVGNQVKPSETIQGQQQVGVEHGETKIPQFRCTICNVTCTRSEDLNCHLWGRRHLTQVQRLSEGQVSAAPSVAPKNSDIPNQNASTFYKAVDPKTETSKCYMPIEESKKSVLATNMVENQVKPSENVPGQQQVGKEHGETNIPQFQCTICNVSCARLEDFHCHLRGRKHLAWVQKLSEGQVSPASSVAPKNSDILNNNASECYKAVNPKTETSKRYMPIEESKKPELSTNVVGNQVKPSENVPGQQQVGVEHGETKIPQFRCTICNVTCTRSEDLNCHLWGRRHLTQVQKLSEGQVSAAPSVAPKNSDIPNQYASTFYKAVDPKIETSKCYMPIEESKKSVLAANMVENQVKPSENVPGQQQVGKEHDETNIPQFRCTICNVSCTRSEDFNCHLWGRKHIAQVQKLNNL